MSDPQASTFQLGTTVIGMAGGLALFLFGLEQMTESLKVLAGNRMKKLLAKATGDRFRAATTGAVVTAIIQSSSATTVLVVSFISAGLLTLSQAIPLIMGANIGTTVTAQIVAFKITQYAMILIAIGFAVMFLSHRQRTRSYGQVIMGLGLIFFGMQLMTDATYPLRSYEPFIELMKSMDHVLWAVLAGMVFTAIIQSSSATTGVVIVLAGQGFITLEAGIALAMGANVGTCATALLASIGKPAEAVQGAAAHVIFNVLGVLLWIGLIDQLAFIVRSISPASPELIGIERMAAEVPRQVANAHAVFNVANTVLFIGFTGPMARIVCRLVPVRPRPGDEAIQPKYIDATLLQTPDLALDRVQMETARLGRLVVGMVKQTPSVVLHGTTEEVEQLRSMDKDVDGLHAAIIEHLGQLSMENISEKQSELLHDYIAASNYIENIGDLIETNMLDIAQKRIRRQVRVSDSTETQFNLLHKGVEGCIERALEALSETDSELAAKVAAEKEYINRLALDAKNHLTRRLIAEEPNRLEAYRIESDLIENLQRMYYFAKRIAKVVISVDIHLGNGSDTNSRAEQDGENSDMKYP